MAIAHLGVPKYVYNTLSVCARYVVRENNAKYR